MRYPLGMVAKEAQRVIKRQDREAAVAAQLMQMAISTQPSEVVTKRSTKKMIEAFESVIGDLLGNGKKSKDRRPKG